jgi:hypothetical protein
MTGPAPGKRSLSGMRIAARFLFFGVLNAWIVFILFDLTGSKSRGLPVYPKSRVAETKPTASPEVLAPPSPVAAPGSGSQHLGTVRTAAQAEAAAGTMAISWRTLGGFRYSRAMRLPKEVRDLHEKEISICGFMLPFDRESKIRDFALVEALWSCCYGTPPDVNQVIIVSADDIGGVDLVNDPVQLIGTLDVGEKLDSDGTLMSVYRVRAKAVRRLK